MDAVFTGNEISRRRKALGLTQKELAEGLHVTDKARRELGKTGWVCLVLLFCVYQWIPRNTIRAYYTLTVLMVLFGFGGIVQMFRHGQIRPWNVGDLACFYGAVACILAENFGYLVTDWGFPAGVKLVLRVIAAGLFQLLFCRVMAGRIPKALPLLGLTLFLGWLLWIGSVFIDIWLCFALCLAVYLIYTWRARNT